MSYKRAGLQKKFYDAIIFSMNHCFVLLTRRHGGSGGGGSVGKEGIKLIFIFSHVRQHPLHNSQLTNKVLSNLKLIIKDVSSSTFTKDCVFTMGKKYLADFKNVSSSTSYKKLRV